MENKLPKSWAVFNDGSQLFKDKVIKYLHKNFSESTCYSGTANTYFYGVTTTGIFDFWPVSKNMPFAQILTLQQFIEMTEEWTPKEGEIIEVSNNERDWIPRTFIYKLKNIQVINPIIVYECSSRFKFMRPRPKPQIIDITIEEIAKLKGCKPEQIRIKE